MLRVNYTLERDENDEVRTFTTRDEFEEIPTLAFIEGPNSSGKSHLLNLIALAFFGRKSNNVHDSLVDEVKRLVEAGHQDVTFEIELFKDGEPVLRARKSEDKNTITREEFEDGDWRPLTSERFFRDYDVLYDIPENPRKRIEELTDNIKSGQEEMGGKVQDLRLHVKKTLKEINRSLDPERLAELEKDIEKLKESVEAKQRRIDEINDQVENFKILQSSHFKEEYGKRLEEAKDELESLKKSQRSAKRNQTRYDNKYQETRKRGKETLASIEKHVAEIVSHAEILLEDKEIIDRLVSIELESYLHDLNKLTTLRQILTDLEQELDEAKQSLEETDESNKAQLYSELLSVLQRYEDEDIDLPAVEGGLKTFLEELRSEAEGLQNVSQKMENLSTCREHLYEIRNDIHTFNKEIVPGLQNLKKKAREADIELQKSGSREDRIEELEEQIERYEERKEKYEELYIKCGKPSKAEIDEAESLYGTEFKKYDEEQVEAEISVLEDTLEDLEGKKDDDKTELETKRKEYQKLKDKDEHPLTEHKEFLKELHSTTLSDLGERFRDEYAGYLADLREPGTSNVDEAQEAYNQEIYEYLGDKLGTFKHIDGLHEAARVNLSNDTIITTEGKEIRLRDMGTGQTQSAYLLSKLESLEDKQLIVLFDEVAMMEQSSLQPVINKLQDLRENKKLLQGIIVQPQEDELTVSSL